MDDLESATIGPQIHKKIADPKVAEFWRGVGMLTAEMRKKRHKSQEEFKIPIRTLRRIEKGNEPHISFFAYMCEMKPCIKEMMKLMRLLNDMMETKCLKCDRDCQMYGKTCENVMNAIHHVTGLC